MIAGAQRSAGGELESGPARAHDPLLLGFDDLVDRRHATATDLPGLAGAKDIVAIARAVANRLADRAIGDASALADDHRLLPVFEENAGSSVVLSRYIDHTILKMKFNVVLAEIFSRGYSPRPSKGIYLLYFNYLDQ